MFKVGFADNYAGQVRRTLIHLLFLGLFMALSAILSNQVVILPGLLTGWASSLLYFLLMCHRVRKSTELPPGQALSSMRTGWLLRFGFIISVLALSAQVPGIEFWAAVVGLFSLHIVFMANAVCFVASELITNLGKPN